MGCLGFGMFIMYDVQDVGCLGCGTSGCWIFGRTDVGNLGCSGFGM